ncbi:pectate lyase [Ruminiclostridium cellulolyticum]|uniref:cellulase n=1 Tax=Ruminiclostridium cellulolyticum (strain ATCC 35319 / DSM 5812 / JCM 6584 / H10) TaxID=394503 RepID=B8I0M6_RUMCH|nr:pectate lyase [Ruminiclostridium cellulolyticum]ACL75601.1 pectate lyase [Ruminiclostridium cellulolyticum H10]
MITKTRSQIPKVLLITMLVSVFSLILLFPKHAFASTPDWKSVLKNSDSWFGSSEGIALADSIVKYQLADGGWRKDMTTSTSGSWGKSTIDNDTTTSQIKVLAKTYNQTKNTKYLTSCQKGIDLLLNGQYSNGGWPQVFNDAGTYHAHITYNDNAMIHVMNLLTDVSKKSGDYTFIDSTRASKAGGAVQKGIQCILNTQIIVNGIKTAWCQQHDELTLKPTSGRAYELPSICTSESVGIVNYLKGISNPSTEITNAINSAVNWFAQVKILGIKVVDTGDDRIVVSDSQAPPIWARFYEMGTNRAMFVDRDGSIHYQMSEISQERRDGYDWYGDWPKNLVKDTVIPTPIPDGQYIKSLIVSDTDNAADWSIQTNLQVGDTIYGDRTFKVVQIPQSLAGAEWIRTACDSKLYTSDEASFTAKSDITVYAALDTRVTSIPAWFGSWTKTDETLSTDNAVTYNIYKKDFTTGSSVVLGTNGASSSVVNYTVMVKPKSIILKGDVNGDGAVDALDFALVKRYLLNGVTDGMNLQAADMNNDNSVNAIDLALIRGDILY